MKLPSSPPLLAAARPNAGLILCGFASLAIWLVVLFAPHLAGPMLGGFIIKPTAVPNAGPTWLMLLLFIPYVAAYLLVTRRPRPGDRAVIGVFTALICHALVIRVLPMASTDIYTYVFHGRAAVFHGLNPYAIIPAMVADPFVQIMGSWPSGFRNTYGPLWTTFAALLVGAVGDRPAAQIAVFKALAAAFFLGCLPIVGAMRTAVAGGRRDAAKDAGVLLLFAWNPALLFELVQNGHNDVAMIFFLLLATLFALRKRFAWAGAALSASIMIKYITLLCVPFFVAYAIVHAGDGLRRRAGAVASFLVPAVAVTLAAFAPYWFGPATLAGLMDRNALVSVDVSSPLAFGMAYAFAGGLDRLFEQTTTDVMTGPVVLAFMIAASVLVVAVFRRGKMDDREFVRFVFAPLICYLAMAAFWFMPWYLAWIMPLAIVEGEAFVTFAAGVVLLLLYSSWYTGPLLGMAVGVVAVAPPAAAHVFRRAAPYFRRFR